MALTAYVLFLIFAVLGRVILQYRLTGDHGLRSVNSHSNLLTKISSILLVITFISSFLISILNYVNLFEPQFNLGIIGTIIASLLCLIGIVITIISQYQMGTAWRIGVDETERTDLITHGLYNYVRNPIYSGVILFGFGLLLYIPDVYMLLSLILGYCILSCMFDIQKNRI